MLTDTNDTLLNEDLGARQADIARQAEIARHIEAFLLLATPVRNAD